MVSRDEREDQNYKGILREIKTELDKSIWILQDLFCQNAIEESPNHSIFHINKNELGLGLKKETLTNTNAMLACMSTRIHTHKRSEECNSTNALKSTLNCLVCWLLGTTIMKHKY